MALKAEGMWPCTVLSATYGEDASKPGVTKVQINVRIDEGPSKGQCCTYEDEVNHRSAIYIGRSCRAVGWRGGDDLSTLKGDTEKWIASTGGKSTVEIKHLQIKSGKRAGEFWDKVQSIGRGPKPLKAVTADAEADARAAMRAANADDGVSDPPPQDDIPHASTDDDIPF